jgi:hypothetical protein
MSQSTPAPVEEFSPSPQRNPAVLRCCEARDRSLQDSQDRNLDKYETSKRAEKAYRNALPDLSGYENIRDFIARVSHGMITEDIHAITGPQYLYGAQVAISALRLEPKNPKVPNAPKDKNRAA